MIPSKAVFTHWAFFLARKNLSRKLSWLNRAFIEVKTLNSFIWNLFTVKLRRPWTPEKFQECWLCTGQSQKSSGQASKSSKPQTNYRCCLRFSYLAPYWLISRNTITFHKYFWCSWFCEFHSNKFYWMFTQVTAWIP